ncbi:MAG: hypothetical protein ABEH43_03690 [Flavobacteriales bacterium]
MRKTTFIVTLLTMFTLVSCASLSTQGAKVSIVEEKHLIPYECKSLGKVTASPPYWTSSTYKIKLRNQAGKLGADMLLITDKWVGEAEGVAYKCED